MDGAMYLMIMGILGFHNYLYLFLPPDGSTSPVSPYLKSLSMVAANKLLHLLEAFSTTWFLFSTVQNHHLVFFLLEVFNNIIQYQFDGEWLGSKLFLCSALITHASWKYF